MTQLDIDTIQWVRSHSRPMADLDDPLVFEQVWSAVMLRLDGTPRADSSFKRYRTILKEFFAYCRHIQQIQTDPFDRTELTGSQVSRPVTGIVPLDTRRLASKAIASALIDSVKKNSRSRSVGLAAHIKENELKPGATLLTGQRGGPLAYGVMDKAPMKARERVMTSEQLAYPLARKLYDWRHLCLTNWLNHRIPPALNHRIPPATVALWAGNSVPVLTAYYWNAIDDNGILDALLDATEDLRTSGEIDTGTDLDG